MKNGEKHYVLKNASFEIRSNENLGILGPNGAGKSTLLRMIGGAEAPNSGKIITDANVSWPLGVGVGFQNSLSGRQNIQFVCDINGLSKKETKIVIQDVIDFAEIGKFFDMPVRSYSSGMRARLGFGLSISFDFDYYLIDELTSVGDAIFRKKAKAAFVEIKKKASLIFVAHNLKTIEESCDSALFLKEGNVSYFEDVKDGIASYNEYINKHSKKAPAKKAKKITKSESAISTVSAKTETKKKAAKKKATTCLKNPEATKKKLVETKKKTVPTAKKTTSAKKKLRTKESD